MQDQDWLGLRHVALQVENLEACRAFYCDFLGFRVEWEPDPDNLYLTSGSDNLALHRGTGEAGHRLDHIGFVLARPEAVDRWESRAIEEKIEIVQAAKTHRDGARSFYCRDPEGTLVQLLYHPPLAPKGAEDSAG